MADQARRDNQGKLRWSLVDWNSMEEMVKVLEAGAKHYGVENWKKGLNREEILESIQRHTIALFNKEEIDTDPRFLTHHAGNIMCNAMFYLFHHRNKSFTDKRNNPFQKVENQ